MTTKEYIHEKFPELGKIENEDLREKTAGCWLEAMRRGGWDDIENIPFTLLVDTHGRDLITHTRKVTQMAMAIAGARDDLDTDLIIAGGLLHDVAKLLEYERVDGQVRKSPHGVILRHPVSGAGLAMVMDLPDSIVHIIAAHSKEGDHVKRTPEAIVINHCDFVDFDIVRSR